MKVKKKSKLFAWQEKGRTTGICSKCKTRVPSLTVDHIIPIHILDMLDRTGLRKEDWEENFELICRTCNAFKANRIDIAHPKTKALLQELINNI